MRPEDDPQGEISEGTGELGFFSPHSWWPLFTGLACAVAAIGAAIGWWLFLIGMLFVVFAADRIRLRVLPGRLRPLAPASPTAAHLLAARPAPGVREITEQSQFSPHSRAPARG